MSLVFPKNAIFNTVTLGSEDDANFTMYSSVISIMPFQRNAQTVYMLITPSWSKQKTKKLQPLLQNADCILDEMIKYNVFYG